MTDPSLDDLPDHLPSTSILSSCFSSKISRQLHTTQNLPSNTQYQFIPKRRKRVNHIRGHVPLTNNSQRTPSPLSPCSLDDDLEDHNDDDDGIDNDDACTAYSNTTSGSSSPLHQEDPFDVNGNLSSELTPSTNGFLNATTAPPSTSHPPTAMNSNTYPPSSSMSTNVLSTKRLSNNIGYGSSQPTTNKHDLAENVEHPTNVTLSNDDVPPESTSNEKKIKYPSIFRFVKTTPREESEIISTSFPSTTNSLTTLHAHHSVIALNEDEDHAASRHTQNDSSLHNHRKEVLARKRASLDCQNASAPTVAHHDPHLEKIKDEIHMRRNIKKAQQQVNGVENAPENRNSPIPHSDHSMITEFRRSKLERQLSNNQVVGCKN